MKKYPFKFLDSYNRDDTDIFFGRDEEIKALYEMVFQSSIVLVYGASGTGKTSLIQCGLAGKFKSYDWLPLSVRRGNDITASLEKQLTDAGGNNIDDEDIRSKDSSKELTGLLRLIKGVYLKNFKPLYLIFDQFEELYVLGTKDEQQVFIESVKEILKAEQPVKIIFSIREEYLGYLYDYEKEVPQLFRKKLRIEPMTLDKVTDVIKGINNYRFSNVKIKDDEIDSITQEIFERIRGKKKTLTIQLPYLQVLLDKIYLETTHDESREADALITMEILSHIGDIGDVLRNFLEEQVQKISFNNNNVTPELIWKILSPFCTLEGTKEPISKKELGDRLPDINTQQPKLLNDAVEAFVNSRILNYSENEDLYELAHDSLALRIAEKRSDEEIAILEVQRVIKNIVSVKAAAREYFTERQLLFIEPYLEKFKAGNEERDWIAKSRVYLQDQRELVNKKQQEELLKTQREKSTRKRLRLVFSLLALAILALIIAGYFYLDATTQTQKSQSLTLASLAREQLDNNPTIAIRLAKLAWEKFPTHPPVPSIQNIVSEAFYKTTLFFENSFVYQKAVTSAVFSTDGKNILTGSDDSTAKIWDAESGKLIANLKGHANRVNSAVFSPNGKEILTASDDSTAKIWDAESGKLIADLKGHQGAVNSAVFSSDGTKVATASWDNTAKIWDAESGNLIVDLAGHQGAVNSAVFSPDGKKILTASSDNTAKIWDAESGKLIANLKGHTDWVNSAVFSPDGKKILTVSLDSTAKIWDAESGNLIVDLTTHRGAVNSAVFSPDGKKILTVSLDSTAKIWDAESGNLIVDLAGHQGAVNSAVFSSDGKKILTASSDNTAKIWDAESGNFIIDLTGHQGAVNSAVFSPDGKKILTASSDNTVKIWDVEFRKLIVDLTKHQGTINSAVFSPDGKKIVTASSDSTAKIWDAESRKLITDLKGHTDWVNSAVFSPDGKKIVTASSDNTAKIWDAESGKLIANLKGHTDWVNSAVFSPDGKKIVTASEDNTAKIWDAESGNKIANLTSNTGGDNGIQSPIFLFEGSRFRGGPCSVDIAFVPMLKKINSYAKQADVFIYVISSLRTASFVGGGFLNPATRSNHVVGHAIDMNVIYENGMKVASSAELAKYPLVAEPVRLFIKSIIDDPDLRWGGTFQVKDAVHIDDKLNKDPASWDERYNAIQKSVGVTGHRDVIYSAVFSPDGKKILTASSDNTAKIWDAESGKLIADLKGHTDWVNSAVFSLDGKKIVTASSDNTAKIWDAESGKLIADLKGHTDWVNSAVFSPDGKKILTASGDNSAKIWLTPEGIMDWLKTAAIYKFTQKDLEELGVDFVDLKK